MDEDTITDLKQFITATVAQQTIDLEQRLDEKLVASETRVVAKLDGKGDEILDAIAATMQSHIDDVDERLDNHEKRLLKLEPKSA